MRCAIVVPRRVDGGHRDRLWSFCRQRWETDFPDWPIIEGHHDHGPFNRSIALNSAIRDAGDTDVLLIIDSDVLANREAVSAAVDIAAATGRMVISHDDRIMLNQRATDKVLDGYTGPWRVRPMVEQIYNDSVSCCIAVPRALWDTIGGFPEEFVGWGYEDSAFAIAAETFTGTPIIRLSSELFHLWHPTTPEATKQAPTRLANAARLEQYRLAAGDLAAVRALLEEPTIAQSLPPTRIPRILHRTVPSTTTDQVEGWWAEFGRLHRGWQLRTHRDPLNPAEWPLTVDLWNRCANGAQLAGLVRLEALVTHGGVYVDSDIEPFRSFEPLLQTQAFAAWEDETTVPDALLGAEPNHPAFIIMLDKARSVIEGGGDAWQSGPGVATETLPGRADVLVLPPGAFYPAHYLEKSELGKRTDAPWVFAEHKWAHSWGTPAAKRAIAQRQRRP